MFDLQHRVHDESSEAIQRGVRGELNARLKKELGAHPLGSEHREDVKGAEQDGDTILGWGSLTCRLTQEPGWNSGEARATGHT